MPSRHVLAGRIGAYTMHARHDVMVTSAPGRAAFMARFDREVDADGVLPAAERDRRAQAARSAYFARLAMQSATARRKRSTGGRQATDADVLLAPAPRQQKPRSAAA